jgi:hypothetical protein
MNTYTEAVQETFRCVLPSNNLWNRISGFCHLPSLLSRAMGYGKQLQRIQLAPQKSAFSTPKQPQFPARQIFL